MTPPQRILGRLWTLERRGAVKTCLIVAAADGQEELRILTGQDEIDRSDVLEGRVEVLREAERIRLALEAQGWLRQLVPGAAPAVADPRFDSRRRGEAGADQT